MSYVYHVIPFIGQARGTVDDKAFANVAQQLEGAINEQAKAGWEFVEVSNVVIKVAPGCFGKLFGAAAGFVTLNQLVFRKTVP